jgi:hypothetical protein
MTSSFGIIGLALIPFIFFYISNALSEKLRFLVTFFFSLGLFAAFLTIASVMQDMAPAIANSFAWLNYSIIALFTLYILFELINLSFGFLISVVESARGKK